jgi:hypothetical protein
MMAEAAPFPVLGSIAQSTLDRNAVNIAQFLDELRMIAKDGGDSSRTSQNGSGQCCEIVSASKA